MAAEAVGPPVPALLLRQRIPRRWLDPRAPQRPHDEVALGVAVSVAVVRVLTGEPYLQIGVAGAKRGIGAQRVPERQQRQRMRMPILDQVQVMRAGPRPGPQK